MAKGSHRRPVQNERDQLGCMWGLISMFDFRNGRSTQKLLADRRRASRHVVGAGSPRNKLDKLSCSNDSCQGSLDGEDRKAVSDACKPSVKKLIEEEMFNEQDQKKEISNVDVEQKESDSECEGHRRKSRRRAKRSRKKSSDNIPDIKAAENLKSKCKRDSENQSMNSFDMDNIMEELCHRINQKSIGCLEHDQPSEVNLLTNQRNHDFKEKLSEVIKFLVSQKLRNGEDLTQDGEIHTSKDFMEVLQILGSDEELFLKLLQDPDSLLSKDLQDLQNAQVEKEGYLKSVAGSTLSEQELSGVAQCNMLISRKQRSFFRRKAKAQEESPSNEDNTSQASNRIVILKPGKMGLLNPETENSLGLSTDSHYILRNKVQSERVGSHYFLSEIKRKLKFAMGKEQHADGVSKRFPFERQNSRDGDKGIKENVGRNSPSKEHFFIEKMARPSISVKKGDKTGKLKDYEIGVEHEGENPKRRVSNIYIEAKKHLSEMLSNGDENVDISSKQVPRTLGKILSLAEYNFSPVGSPARNWEHGFVTAHTRFSNSENFQKVNENKQENHVSPIGQTTQNSETQPCISDDRSDSTVETCNSVSINLAEHNDNVVDGSCSTTDGMHSEGDLEISETTETIVQEESKVLDASSEPVSSSITRDDQNDDTSPIHDEKRDSECLMQDSFEESQSSPLASPSNSSIRKVEYEESATDLPERPSPVSVLEPVFTEDDICPPSTRAHNAETPLQPLRIQFEEHDLSAASQGNHIKACMDEKESVFELVKAVVRVSGLTWEEFYMKSLSSDQLLELSIYDEVEFFSNQLCSDQKLLFDCINEVLVELCGHHFGGSPWVSFVKPRIQPIPQMKNAICEVQEGIYWNLFPLPLPCTLDQIVRKDMARTGRWMDLRYDTDCIGVEMGDIILDELMEETIVSCLDSSPESECPLLLAELKED